MTARASNPSTETGATDRPQVAATATVVHIGLILLVLAACLVAPRPGTDLLLIRLGHSTPLAWRGPAFSGLALLGRGPLPGSLVARPSSSAPLWPLLARGILPLGVPRGSCGDTPPHQPSNSSPRRS